MLIHFRHPALVPVPLAVSQFDTEPVLGVFCVQPLPKRRVVIHGEPFETALAHFGHDLGRLVFRLFALLEDYPLYILSCFRACAYKFDDLVRLSGPVATPGLADGQGRRRGVRPAPMKLKEISHVGQAR